MKRISPGTVTLGVFAILFGLVAAYVAKRYLDVETPVVKTPAKPTATVIVPKVNLPKYARVTNELVDAVEVPAEKLPEGAVRMKSRALFRLVKQTVMAGQPLLEKDLYDVGEVPKLADELPPGYRAVTLSVDAKSALNGMIQPGSIVDISMTVKDKHPEVGGLATLTVMRGVKVLATSEKRFPASEDRAGQLRNMTVAVTPEQANKLILAQQYGTLSVTLRSTVEGEGGLLADVSSNSDERDLVNPAELLGLSEPEPAPIAPIPQPEVRRAEIWRGGQRVEVTFNYPEIQEALNATAVAEGREPTRALPVGVPTAAEQKSDCPECERKKAARRAAEAARAAGPQASAVPGMAPLSDARPSPAFGVSY